MNHLLSGLVGSGKSYHATKMILDDLRRARVVVTNIPLRLDRIEKDETLLGKVVMIEEEDLTTGQFFFDNPGGAFYIDECHNYLPSGLQQKDLPPGWSKLIGEHRHYEDWKGRSSEVYLITQTASKLPRCVRLMLDYTFVYKKLRQAGLSKCFVARQYEGSQDVNEATEKALVGREKGKYSPSVYKYYSSHMGAGQNAAMLEHTTSATGLKSALLRVAVFVLIAVVTVGFVGGEFLFSSGGNEPADVRTEVVSVAKAVTPKVSPVEPEPKKAVESSGSGPVQLSGFVQFGARCFGYDLDGRRVSFDSAAQCERARHVRLQAQVVPEVETEGFGDVARGVLSDGLIAGR